MKCPQCGLENESEKRFCVECGRRLARQCPECKSELKGIEKFCGECGHNLTPSPEAPPRALSFEEKVAKIQRYLPGGFTEKILSQRDRIEGERKQVTVMFCDMAGFTALTERLGPEEAYAIMDNVYGILIHKVHDFEGTVNEMTGDGIVALFGAPIALEDPSQRAIRSEMSIHREMVKFSERMKVEKTGVSPLKMRIGIHSGPVVVGTLGNDLRVGFKAVGDTVNLAARMEQLADPGTTYVSEATFKLAEGMFRFEALGKRDIKGKEEPVPVYRVIAPSGRRTRFDVSAGQGLTPLVARKRELDILLDGFERARAGRGQAISIVAEAGVGKSRLLYEFRKAVTNEEVTFLEGKCLSYSRGMAYHPIIDMLKSNFHIQDGDGEAKLKEKVKEGLEILGADLPSNLPYLLELLSVQESGIEEDSMSPETRKDRIIQTLQHIVLKGSEIRPLIMVFEDLHWMDQSSERVCKQILRKVPGARVLMILTYRPECVPPWGRKPFHSQVTLNRLSDRESLSMIHHLLSTREIEQGLQEFVLEKTEGIPLFVEEFVKSLRDLGIIELRESKYHLARRILGAVIPSTIHDVIMARVDALAEGAKEVLQIGSVIEREFAYEMIKRVTGLSEGELLAHLSQLKDSEFLYERGISPDNTYVFKHAMTQEVAYSSLLFKRRKEIHEKIGRVLEEMYADRLHEFFDVLAYHYLRSENKPKTVQYLYWMNRKAARAGAVVDAKAHFDLAMGLLDQLPETEGNRRLRISLLVNQPMVFELLVRLPEYYELLTRYKQDAVELCDAEVLGAFHHGLGHCEWWLGFFEQAKHSVTKSIELCEAAGNTKDALASHLLLEWNCLYLGDLERVIELKDVVLHKMGQRFHHLMYVRALSGACFACALLGRWDEAEEVGEEALRVAEAHSNDSQISFAAWNMTAAFTLKGDRVRSCEYGELAVTKAPSAADRVWGQGMRAWAWSRAGMAKEALQTAVQVVSVLRAGGHVPAGLYAMLALVEIYLLAEDYEQAEQSLQDPLEISDRCGAKYFLGWSYRLFGEIAITTNPDDAVHRFEKAISIFHQIKAENDLALAYSGMGRFHKQQGNTAQAGEYLTQALKIFERLGTLIEPNKVRKELAELPQ